MSVLTQDYTRSGYLFLKQREFDLKHHGSLTILRRNIEIQDINFLDAKCILKYSFIIKKVREIAGREHAIIHCLRGFPEGVSGMLCKLSSRGKYKLVTYAHGEEILIAKTSRQLKVLTRLVYKYSDLVIANSYSTKKLVEEICPSSRVSVIHPGVHTALFDVPIEDRIKYRKNWGWPGNTIVLVTIARMEPRKNHAGVIKAMADLRGQGLPLAYVVGSDGEEREKLIALVKELGLEHWVRFTGQLSETDKALTFASADIHVMPSIQLGSMIEGFGIVFLEAAAAGIPSIGGNIGGQPEAIMHGETGVIVDGNKPEEVKHAIQFLAENESVRNKMGKQGRKWAREHEWSEVTRKTVLEVTKIRTV